MEASAAFSWAHWHVHPSIALGVLFLAGAYLLSVGPLRQRYGWADRPDVRRGLFFGLGLLVLLFALQSPLHDLGDVYLFSAHMVQHMLLVLAVAPLLLLGTPDWLLRPLLRPRPIMKLAQVLTRPLVALALFNTTLLLWHMPAAYELALQDRGVHILQHLLFLGTAMVMWWPLLNPLPELHRLSPPGQMLYLFLQSMLPAVLGAFIIFSNDVLYPTYAAAPRVYGISPLTDQQMGGLLMKVPGTLVLWGVLTVIFFKWAGQEQRREEETETRR